MKKVQEAQIEGKNILLRIDTDVPMASQWTDGNTRQIIDDQRLQASIPTIKYLLENGAKKISIMGHVGQPKGKIDFTLSLWPVANRLAELLGFKEQFFKPQINYSFNEKIIIYENIRFDPREEKNDPSLASDLAKGQDLFVQDAFATCHRNHASIAGIKKILPTFMGFSVQKEVENLTKLIFAQDILMIIGGKKAKDKLPIMTNLANKTQAFLVGGVVANTILAKKGLNLGKSLVENEVFEIAGSILSQWGSTKLHLPLDIVLSKSIKTAQDIITVKIDELHSQEFNDYYIVDIGPQTISQYIEIIAQAKVIFWNGNLGISEVPAFAKGTQAIAQAIIGSTAKKYVGGGDTTKFLRQVGWQDKFDFISNGGGATLDFLAGKQLPGL